MEIRPFRNQDAPLVADVWRSQAAHRGLAQPLTAAMFEELVLAKCFFDRDGLLLAVDGDLPLGFVHAGFGPDADLAGYSRRAGVVSRLMLRPGQPNGLAEELLMRAEAYLRCGGAESLWAGGFAARDPFYTGLTGGSEVRGLLQSDEPAGRLFAAAGYQQVARAVVLHRELAGFRPLVDRAQMQLRRRFFAQILLDPPAANWWDAATLGGFERTRFELRGREALRPQAEATFWMMAPFSTSWGVHAAGLVSLEVDARDRRTGLATFLIGEALRQLAAQGISVIEAQVDSENIPALRFFAKLGFEQVDVAVSYRKPAAGLGA